MIDPTALPIPWNMALGILEIHITSHLYRQGMVPWAAMEYIDLSSTERLPIIERFFDRMEADRKAIIEAGRNPSIEYLSLRSFFMMVNRNLEDESIKLPITTVGAYNASDVIHLRPIRRESSNVYPVNCWKNHKSLIPTQWEPKGRNKLRPDLC